MLQMIIVGALAASAHWLLYRRLVIATGVPGPAKVAAVIVLGLLWVAAVIALGAGSVYAPGPVRPVVWLGYTWFVVLLYLLLGLLVIGLVLLVLRLTGSTRRTTWLRVLSAVAVVVSLGAVGVGVVQAENVRVVETEGRFADLPRQFDGLRVAVVSDLHVGAARGPGFTARIVDLVNAQHPDLIVLPGDLLDGAVDLVSGDIAPLAELRARYGVIGVAGNHEGYVDEVGSWLDHWETLGIETLRNTRTELSIDGASIDIAGVYDYAAPAPYAPDLDAALAGTDPARFTLLLAHQPRQAPAAGERDVDLQLSGHTHGGQLWPFVYPVRWANPTVSGWDRFGDMRIFTTVGAGAWGPPVRLGVPPEVVILTLRTA
ncbi:metallophosphoesterase [Nocardia neocaledoniensis]|uniref:metallophosphoesterase n=1 Tax=Nocardia neocaledoniensis TaxID=236511 RepID=UPI003CC80560